MFVVFFIVKSKSNRSPETDFAAEAMMTFFGAIFVYIAANFRITRKIRVLKHFEYKLNIRPILTTYLNKPQPTCTSACDTKPSNFGLVAK